jgi:hypothetical protein
MSTMQTVDQLIAEIMSTNQMYLDNRNQWKYLLESYLGGADYRQGQHLTRYQLETANEYLARLQSTPLENHCKSVVSVYNSFLFREDPDRDFGSISNAVELDSFLKDADLDGRSLNSFMKDVATWSSVFGHCWIIMAKPSVGAVTRADELAAGVRPYVSLVTPLTVMDWSWHRQPNGYYALDYLKYVEEITGDVQVIKEWTPETITTWEVDINKRLINMEVVEDNELGRIPAVIAYGNRSMVRGLGISDISDIADAQRFIYNNTSEVEQSIRLDSHPSLVKTPETIAGSGAGSMIHMPENLDSGLRPYLLEYSGASVASIYQAIKHTIDSIDKMANTGAVRATESRDMSGVAIETEFQLLNAKLSEKADNLELAEEQMWKLWAEYMGYEWDGEIDYPGSFNIRDTETEIRQLQMAKSTATDPVVLRKIDEHILEWMDEEKEVLPYIDLVPIPGRTYPDGAAVPESLPPAYQDSTNPEVPVGQNCANCEYYKSSEQYCMKFDAAVRPLYWCAKWEGDEESMSESSEMLTPELMARIQELLMSGMSNADIMAELPGITVEDIVAAAAEAARRN